MDRLTRDQMLMVWAHVAAARGTCKRLQVGAILSFESRPISAGYNGSPPGERHCGPHCDTGKACVESIHAEYNAIKWARAFGINPEGSTLHITDSPCNICAERIIDAGILRVVFDRPYRDDRPLVKLKDHGVEVGRCQVSHVINATSVNSLIIPASRG